MRPTEAGQLAPVAPAFDATTDFLPSAAARRLEARAYVSLVRVVGRPVPQPAPSDRLPVVPVPGFISGDVSLTLLARDLRRRGYRTFGSRIGANLGCSDAMVQRLVDRIAEVAEDEGRRVALVGHSRGGMIAKLAAIRRPDLVAGLGVLSAPVTGTLRVAAHVRKQLEMLFRLQQRGVRNVLGQDCVSGECAGRIAAELTGPFPAEVAYLSVYSRFDAIIDWRTCLDPAAELVEIATSHTAMGTDPRVHQVVARFLDPLGAAPIMSRDAGAASSNRSR